MSAQNHPQLYLVRPNIGQPLMSFLPQMFEPLQLTFAGKTEQIPTRAEVAQWLRGDSLTLLVSGVEKGGLEPDQVRPVREIPAQENDPPLSSSEYQRRFGFRWECNVDVTLSTSLSTWPQMFDIRFEQRYWDAEQKEYARRITLNPHAIYVDRRWLNLDRLTIIHVTDLHISRRNDLIPDILADVRTSEETRQLLSRYSNFNDNFRNVIRYANDLSARGELIILVATGDLVDYYHDGWFAWDNGRASWSQSNFGKFLEILEGSDGKGPSLNCPIFVVLGNHDYLQHEWPLRIDVNLGGVPLFKLREKNCFKSFNLSENEGKEYDYWWAGCPKSAFGLVSADDVMERRKYFKDPGGHELNMNDDDAYKLGTPHYEHLEPYFDQVNFDVDFTFTVGSHQFVCLNTGPDRYPSKDEMVFGGGDHIRDYKNDGAHNRGITSDHLKLVEHALENTQKNGLVFCFAHAPLICLPDGQTDGAWKLYEDNHEKESELPNQVTDWFFNCVSSHYAPYLGLPPVYSRSQFCEALRTKGYPQEATRYFRRGQRDVLQNWSCADGEIQEMLGLTVRCGSWPFASTATVTGPNRKLAALFAGHTHGVHELRIEGPKTPEDIDTGCFYHYVDDYSGSEMEEPPSLRISDGKRKWLVEHAPLFMTSGGTKNTRDQFREIVIDGDCIESMFMRQLENGEGQIYDFREDNISLRRSFCNWRRTWNTILWGDFGGGRGDDLFFYDPSVGEAEFYADVTQQFRLMKRHSGFRRTWSVITPGNFGGRGYTDLLFYDSTKGEGEFYAITGPGDIRLLRRHVGWSRTWSHIVPAQFVQGGTTDLLFYDKATGDMEIYATDHQGSIRLLMRDLGWRKGWSHITPVRSEKSSCVFFYDQSNGYAELYSASPVTADFRFMLAGKQGNLGKDWTQVVHGKFGGSLGGMMFYSSTTGLARLYEIGVVGGLLKQVKECTGWRRGWSLATGNWIGHRSVLFYDSIPTSQPPLEGLDSLWVSSGKVSDLDYHRAPYPSYPACSAHDIIGIANAQSDGRWYAWRRNGEFTSGRSDDLDCHQGPLAFSLPAGKKAEDVIGIAIAANDRVYAWYRDGTYSAGTNSDLDQYETPRPFRCPAGKKTGDIIAMGIAKSDNRVYAWYQDGTYSSGITSDLGVYGVLPYSLPPRVSADDVVDIDIDEDDQAFVWFKRRSVVL